MWSRCRQQSDMTKKFSPTVQKLRLVTNSSQIERDPTKIAEDIGKEAYRLEHLDGKKIPRIGNATNLHFYYS
ncbi:hypothetical protein CR513_31267, partial [Mucuna pruriens]